jgi:hypothetical protein
VFACVCLDKGERGVYTDANGGRMNKLMAGLLFALMVAWPFRFAQAQEPVSVGVHHQTIWVPDYYGSKVYRYLVDYTVSPPKFSSQTIDVSADNCNPNSVAIKGAKLYVVCNSDYGQFDQILVFNTFTLALVRVIDGTGPSGVGDATFAYFSGASLVGIAFDIHGNLWVSGNASNSLYRIPAAELKYAAPQIDRQVVHSPDSPAGLTFTASGALWVVGQFSSGILLEFPDSVINAEGTYLNNVPYSPNPAKCLSNVLTGCNPTASLFNNPEGVAVFDGAIWVSNNGGGSPAKTLVRAVPDKPAVGQFKTSTYGGALNAPFSCPGGLFAPTLAGATPELWVNDEGFGFGPLKATCGATETSQGSGVGLVHAFSADDLMNHKAGPTPEAFPGAAKLKTGSPGFGGVFVQLD